jgi:hypothetical protein
MFRLSVKMEEYSVWYALLLVEKTFIKCFFVEGLLSFRFLETSDLCSIIPLDPGRQVIFRRISVALVRAIKKEKDAQTKLWLQIISTMLNITPAALPSAENLIDELKNSSAVKDGKTPFCPKCRIVIQRFQKTGH